MKTYEYWYLVVQTFVGTVPGASHYRGHIEVAHGELSDIYIEREMTYRERVAENKSLGFTAYRKGAVTTTFSAEEEVENHSIETLKRSRPDVNVILLRGRSCVCDPMKCLVGPDDFLNEANEIYAAWESNDGWGWTKRETDDPKEIEAERLSKMWDDLLSRFPSLTHVD